jgi:hypothetical protein
VLAIVVGAMIVLATLVVALSTTRSTADYDPATPEGTVQAYVSAVVEGDYAEAAGLLAADSRCAVEDFDRIGTVGQVRVSLVNSQVAADTARVTVAVTTPAGGGPFDTSEYTEDHIFRLARSGQGWRISGIPWPLYTCGEEVK